MNEDEPFLLLKKGRKLGLALKRYAILMNNDSQLRCYYTPDLRGIAKEYALNRAEILASDMTSITLRLLPNKKQIILYHKHHSALQKVVNRALDLSTIPRQPSSKFRGIYLSNLHMHL
jgi:hypothetical protein